MYFSLENIHKILTINTTVQDVNKLEWPGNQDFRAGSPVL